MNEMNNYKYDPPPDGWDDVKDINLQHIEVGSMIRMRSRQPYATSPVKSTFNMSDFVEPGDLVMYMGRTIVPLRKEDDFHRIIAQFLYDGSMIYIITDIEVSKLEA